MPVQLGKDKEGCYAKWGPEGAKYHYECGNEDSRNRAKDKALEQGRAIEASKSSNFEETYTDYPQAASENAKIALRWAEENGWGSCGTQVGKIRANQLANREPISRDTIARMSAFERHRQNSQKELGDGCGRLMWLAWGGDEGIEWASRKLKQIDSKFNLVEIFNSVTPIINKLLGKKDVFVKRKISFDYDGTLTTEKGQRMVKNLLKQGARVYIITRRRDGMMAPVYALAKELGINRRNVYNTNNKLKWETVQRLNIDIHYDNNLNEVKHINDNTTTRGRLFI
jgi:hypothetical protein